MSKSKNHTNHNQSEFLAHFPAWIFYFTRSSNHPSQFSDKKAHRNGIHKPKSNRHASLKGVDAKFIKNQRHAKAGSLVAVRKAREAKA
ncbi:hypothetical protein INT44_009302 [Umbelopsis vinacea]|uniref:60S ribosomal protein L29 n=1 Tax=Umbelopsis vinacea TaxID=44442 RepID=A0A8H7Q1B5_9FUNG|nr:hypothetical protein INT44_009302 [Umbelopsis vinacea]